MSKFLVQLALFTVLLIGGYFFIRQLTTDPNDTYEGFSYSYMSGIKIKHQRAESIKTPKLLFVGGSSFGYGIDSESIEKHTSVPVVNLGHNAGLGIPFLLYQAKSLMRKGDVVFLCIEYLMGKGDYRLIKEMCKEFPEVEKFPHWNLRDEIGANLSETREGLRNWVSNKEKQEDLEEKRAIEQIKKHGVEGLAGKFNKYGDVVYHLYDASFYTRPSDGFKASYRYWSELELINQFKKEAERMGVDVYFSYPPLAKSTFDRQTDLISRIDIDVRNIVDAEVINTYDQLVFDDSCFYDTEYHLTAYGRERRTKIFFETILNNTNVRKSVMRARDAQKQ